MLTIESTSHPDRAHEAACLTLLVEKATQASVDQMTTFNHDEQFALHLILDAVRHVLESE